MEIVKEIDAYVNQATYSILIKNYVFRNVVHHVAKATAQSQMYALAIMVTNIMDKVDVYQNVHAVVNMVNV